MHFELDTFGVARQNLVFNFVDIAIDRSEQLLPANSQCFHGVLSVAIFKDHRFLNALIELLQFFHVRFVGVDVLLVLLQTHQLIF